ncbi:MAG: TetR/AcrR family transcriptional regulator [Bdellovibrionota bacterium]
MPMASKGEKTKEKVVDLALKTASRDGLEGLSIGQLAGKLKLSKAGLILHFGSKEELQLEVLREGARRFREEVVLPALEAKKGLPRVKALMEQWLAWALSPAYPGGCPLLAAGIELDDKPGVLRDYLVSQRTELLDTLAGAARRTIETGEFKKNLDTEQFAFEWFGVLLAFHHAQRLLKDPKAEKRARVAFGRLLESAGA